MVCNYSKENNINKEGVTSFNAAIGNCVFGKSRWRRKLYLRSQRKKGNTYTFKRSGFKLFKDTYRK